MKLISLYIENFGGLSRYALRFDPKLTVVEEPNGFGKTTLAEFIRAMFYGFPRASGKLDKNLRKKYMPWQGGRYGGNLVFEQAGKLYKIERFFGSVPKQDSFVLYDHKTHRKSMDYSENIGVELFQLDTASFERSTYLAQNRDETVLATDQIRAKLGNLVEDTGDINHFEKAVAALRAKRSGFIPYRGEGGSVAEAQRKISQLQDALSRSGSLEEQLDRTCQDLEEKRKERAVKEGARERIRQKIAQASEAAAAQVYAQRLETLQSKAEMYEKEQQKLREAFPKGLPRREDLDRLDALYDQALTLENQKPWGTEEDRQQAWAEQQAGRFAAGIPDTETLQVCKQAGRTYLSLESDCKAAALSPEEQKQYAALRQRFAAGTPTGEELNRQQEKLRQAQQLRQENVAMTAAGSAPVQAKPVPQRKKAFLPLLTLGLLALIGGVVLMTVEQYGIGGVALAVGVVLLVAAGYLRLHQELTAKLSAVTPNVGVSEEEKLKIRVNEQRARELEQEIRQFVGGYGLDLPEAEALQQLSRQAETFQILSRRLRQSEEIQRERKTLEQKLTGFLSAYYPAVRPEQFLEALSQLEQDCRQYESVRTQLEEKKKAQAQWQQQLQALAEQFQMLQQAVGVPLQAGSRQQLQQLRDQLTKAAALKENICSNRQELEMLQQDGAAYAEAATSEPGDPDGLRRSEENLTEELHDLGQAILELEQKEKQLNRQWDALPICRDELEAWQEKQSGDLQKAACLDKTMDFLQQAKDRLSNSYLGPIRQKFAAYLRELTRLEPSGLSVSPDLEIAVERQGASRELGYFSAGQTDLVVLCMRLALVDTLFQAAEPLVILDDPFVNLDDVHTERALQLLQRLSENHQILYLVCNSSRSPL